MIVVTTPVLCALIKAGGIEKATERIPPQSKVRKLIAPIPGVPLPVRLGEGGGGGASSSYSTPLNERREKKELSETYLPL